MANTEFLDVPGGQLAYEVVGPVDGPLVIALPGMGDLRQSYRFLAPRLADAGYRVASVDLRGQGESSTGWDSYRPEAVGADVLALIEHLGGPAVLVATSFSPSAAAWAAVQAPAQVAGLVLLSMFTDNPTMNPVMRLVSGQVMSRRALWLMYWKSLFTTVPADFAANRELVERSFGRTGMAAVRAMGDADKTEANASLPRVTVPTLVLYGSKDPDFPDLAAQAKRAQELLPHATVQIVDGVKHYPATEAPDVVAPATLQLLKEAFDA
ncbi:alpha/beta fold hydrolase [Actinocatenispora sera]|uniref:Hydrolase n=1 Tax=Actinocatenispora sera TaxID=390989 RepID=A0A810KVL6_9ACTN|nr:alpha/beta hydrolase [Actinocatenispora sera]BCJ26927.1 hydrolase [Actinocatenispora sera]